MRNFQGTVFISAQTQRDFQIYISVPLKFRFVFVVAVAVIDFFPFLRSVELKESFLFDRETVHF